MLVQAVIDGLEMQFEADKLKFHTGFMQGKKVQAYEELHELEQKIKILEKEIYA